MLGFGAVPVGLGEAIGIEPADLPPMDRESISFEASKPPMVDGKAVF